MSLALEQFLTVQPSPENHWRALILFGRNSASYKFALAHALLELTADGRDFVRMEELANPFSKHICRHLATSPKQATSASSKFLAACAQWNDGELSDAALIETTVRYGFNNVIDAFHNIGGSGNGSRFFIDQRLELKGIRVTDELHRMLEAPTASNLNREVESRWRLVETAWSLGLTVPLIEHENDGLLSTRSGNGRITITSCRDALNGYQKGKCFYCSQPISLEPGHPILAHVDHFIPFVLMPILRLNLNGVWNLVLSCQECNLAKSDAVPVMRFAESLHRRNEYLIMSHHPLRETLLAQTGLTAKERVSFIGGSYSNAVNARITQWEPRDPGPDIYDND
jgi:hypothetical protein